MQKRLVIAITAGGVIAGSVLWYGIAPLFMHTVLDEALPIANQPAREPTPPKESGVPLLSSRSETSSDSVPIVATPLHPASGTVRIVSDGARQFLRYENFKTLNGPDLLVYLATDLQASEYINLGPLKATEGNVNYTIPSDTDLTKYHYALVWCEDFSILFNSADLTPLR